MTIQLKITPELVKELNYQRYHHLSPLVQRRMDAVRLKAHGLLHKDIAEVIGISDNTLRDYLELYEQGGLEKLKEIHYYQPESELTQHIVSLETYFQEHPPATIKQAQRDVEVITGVHRSETQVREFLKKKLNLRCRKVGSLPAKADPEQQQKFLEQELQPRLDEAEAGKRVVFFVDAAHFVLAPFLGFLWSVVRLFVRAPSGRQRFNVLGALNAISHDLVTITNETYITAQSVCALLEKIAQLYVGLPITIFLDNARYQHCALVLAKAKSLDIELCFLPAYSPNLNLIERVWKFVKKQCLYSQYYEKFPSFKEAILKCLGETQTTHHAELDSLLTLRFQLFEKAQFVPA